MPAQPTTRHSARAVTTARGVARQRRPGPSKGAAEAASVVYVGESIRSRGRQIMEYLITVAILCRAVKIIGPSGGEVYAGAGGSHRSCQRREQPCAHLLCRTGPRGRRV